MNLISRLCKADPLEVNVSANEITNLKVNYFIARFSEIGQFVLMYLKAS